MPNPVKYSTTPEANSLKKGDVVFGVKDVEYGPTSTTGWYSGITPSSGKYVIYKAFDPILGLDPDIFAPQTDSELFQLVKSQGGSAANAASVSSSLSFFDGSKDYLAANFVYENIITDGLVFHVDAGFVGSLPLTGSNWYDLSGQDNDGLFVSSGFNSITFNTANSGSLSFTGTTNPSWIRCSNSSSLQISSGSISAWVKASNGNSGFRGVIVKQLAYGLFVYDDYLATYDWTTSQIFQTTTTIGNSLWCYITLTFDGVNVDGGNIYHNAVNVNPSTFNIYTSSQSQPLLLGAGSTAPSQLLIGNIAIASVYNRVLSPTEIQKNFDAQKARFGL